MATKRAPVSKTRHFAAGGILGVPVIDPNGSDFDAINAEKTQRWAAEDAAKLGVRGPATGYQGYTEAPKASPFPVLDNPFGQARSKQPVTGIDPQFLTPETTFQEDSDARQSRITGYADKLKTMEANGRANGLTGFSSTITRSFADGGKIEGKGTPTSDSIPGLVRETGEAIRVSTKERILSKAQDSFLEEIAQASGFDSLNDMLQAGTGQQVGPTIKSGRRAAATGMAPEAEQRPEALGIDGRVASAIAAPPTLGGAPLARSEPVGGGLTRAAQQVGYRPEINGINWNAKGFDPTKQDMAPGTGAIAITGGPNAGKNIAVGPQSYTSTDGTSTSDWLKTAQYSQGVTQANKDRETLATMQRDRLERDAYSPEITDPRAQINARQQLQDIDAKASKEGEAYGRLLDNQTKLTKLASDGQMAGLQAQYLGETDPARREALAERIRGVQGKGVAAAPANLQHIETERGTMVFDPRTGRMVPAVGPDGAPVGSGKALTEFQGKSTSFGMRADAASQVIDTVGQGGKVQPSLIKRAAESVPLVGEGLGMAANRFASPEQQQVEQAQRDFLNAVLRQESGAAISASEFDNARKQYFAQPNDSQEVIAQKKANREMAINGFRISSGPGARNIGGAPAQSQQPQQPQQQPAAAPKVGMVDGKHVFLGGNPADPASWAEVR